MTTVRIGSRPRRRSRARSGRISEVRRPGSAPLLIILLLAMGALALAWVAFLIGAVAPEGTRERLSAADVQVIGAAVRQRDLFHEAGELAMRCPGVRPEARDAVADGSVDSAEVGRLKALASVRCRIG